MPRAVPRLQNKRLNERLLAPVAEIGIRKAEVLVKGVFPCSIRLAHEERKPALLPRSLVAKNAKPVWDEEG